MVSPTLMHAARGGGHFAPRGFLVNTFNLSSLTLGSFALKFQLQKFWGEKKGGLSDVPVGLHTDHPKSQALHAEPQLPIGRESGAVPMPHRAGLSLAVPPRPRHNPSCSALLPARGASRRASRVLLHAEVCGSRGASNTTKKAHEPSVPSGIGREGGTASGAQTGSVWKRADPESMSGWAPMADASS